MQDPSDREPPSEAELSRLLERRDLQREGERRRQSRWLGRALIGLALLVAIVLAAFPGNLAAVWQWVKEWREGPPETSSAAPPEPVKLPKEIRDIPFGKEFIEFIHPAEPPKQAPERKP